MCYLNSLTIRMTGAVARLGLGPSMSSILRMAVDANSRWPLQIAELLASSPRSSAICLNDDYVRATAYRVAATSGGVGRTSRSAWYVTSVNVVRPSLPPIMITRFDPLVKFDHLGAYGLQRVVDAILALPSLWASWRLRATHREPPGTGAWQPLLQDPSGASRLDGMLTDILPTACHSSADILLTDAYSFWRLLPNFDSGATMGKATAADVARCCDLCHGGFARGFDTAEA